jgi:acylphosphatase
VSDVVAIQDVPGVLRAIGLTPGQKYPFEELRRIITQAKADQLKLQGYVLRMDTDGYVEIVHVSQADDFQSNMRNEWRRGKKVMGPRGKREVLTAPGFDGSEDPQGPPVDGGVVPAVRKRTPQERLDSLMTRWVEDCKRQGTVPGLDDPMISTILDMAWRSGKTQITAEHIRTVARYFLERAEKEKGLRDYKKTVRPPHGS